MMKIGNIHISLYIMNYSVTVHGETMVKSLL